MIEIKSTFRDSSKLSTLAYLCASGPRPKKSKNNTCSVSVCRNTHAAKSVDLAGEETCAVILKSPSAIQ